MGNYLNCLPKAAKSCMISPVHKIIHSPLLDEEIQSALIAVI